MKKALLLAGLLLSFFINANAFCNLLIVTNNTACTLYFTGVAYTPPSCTTGNNIANTTQIQPGATIVYCISDPTIGWSPAVPNGTTDSWMAVKVESGFSATCPSTGIAVGMATCGFPNTDVLYPGTGSGCPAAACPSVTATWSNPSPGHWVVTLN